MKNAACYYLQYLFLIKLNEEIQIPTIIHVKENKQGLWEWKEISNRVYQGLYIFNKRVH